MKKIPNHLAFIMDGNGRWATRRLLPRSAGHLQGIKTVEKVLKWSKKYNVACVSLFVFSTENWSRPQKEIDGLFDLARNFLKSSNKFLKQDIRVVVSGDVGKLPSDLIEKIASVTALTENCTSLTLNLCLNYGGQDEILMVVNKLLKEGKTSVTKSEFSKLLYTGQLPDVDMIVRTSGELRLSNFLLFQAAYAELYFDDVLWPDICEKDFVEILNEFSNRTRKFGDVDEK